MSQSKAAHRTPSRLRASASVVLAIGAGGLLRVWMLKHFFEVNGDSLVYGGIAKNLLLHGSYALTVGSGQVFPTLIRLPGYPLFLAGCFSIFGMENYRAAAWVQIALDLCACLLLADFARHITPQRLRRCAIHGTLWLAALCPFTAIYAASPLTEGPTLFALVLGLWAAARFQERPGWRLAITFTLAVAFAALLRPDGALAGVALAPAMFAGLRMRWPMAPKRWVRMAVVCGVLAVAPFAAWTWRNWKVFHVFEPLAPKSATDPGDPVYRGWERWVATWCLDFVSTYDVVWNVPGDALDVRKLPDRAFDSAAQRTQTETLAAQYNGNGWNLTPEIDAGFARLAAERIDAHPLRYYVLLPLERVADMWLRPRVENLPIDLDWWVYAHHHTETEISWAYAALNAVYLLLGAVGLFLRPRMWLWMLAYMLLRSAMLLTVVPPEARYTIECFPMLLALGGVAVGRMVTRTPGAAYSR